MTSDLRIVVAGCGGISTAWFDAAADIEGISIVGVVDLNLSAAQRRKDDYKLAQARTGTNFEAMLEESRPDIVFDCTVPEARASIVQAALRAGCHVLSEKPMAASMNEAHSLVESARKADKIFAIMQNRRYNRRIRSFQRFLSSSALGKLTTLNADFYLGAHFGGFRDKMPHVLLLDMAIHSFDQARLISGADPVAVYCHEWNPAGSWYEHSASAMALFEMSNGIIFNYRGSWCAEGLNTSWECDWRALAGKGSALWDGQDVFRAQVALEQDSLLRPTEDITIPQVDQSLEGHAGCITDFIDCIRAGRVPETVCTENIKSLAMVFGAIESAEAGQRVLISL